MGAGPPSGSTEGVSMLTERSSVVAGSAGSSETTGAVGLALTLIVTVAVPVRPTESVAVRVSRWLPAVSPVTFRATEPAESGTEKPSEPSWSEAHSTSRLLSASSRSWTVPVNSIVSLSLWLSPADGVLMMAVGGFETVRMIESVQVPPTSSRTVIVMLWVAAESTVVGSTTSPAVVGSTVPSAPSTLEAKDADSQSAGTSGSATVPSRSTRAPIGAVERLSGAVISQLGAVFGGPTTMVTVAVAVRAELSVAVATRT